MEFFGQKCAPTFQKVSSADGAPISRLNSSVAPRRPSPATSYLRYENSYALPPEAATPAAAPTVRPYLISSAQAGRPPLSRRPGPYVYNQQPERPWLQRPSSSYAARKPYFVNDQRPSTRMENCEKSRLIPPQQQNVVQPQLPPQQPPLLQPQQPPPNLQPAVQIQQVNRERNPSASVELKQVRLQQRADQLFQRLSRVQFAQSRLHTDGELNSTINSIQRALDTGAAVRDAETLSEARALLSDDSLDQKLENLIKSGFLKPEFFNCPELRTLTPAATVHFLRRNEPTLKKIISLMSSTSNFAASSSSTPFSSIYSLPVNMALDPENRQYLGRVTQSLQSHLASLKRRYDADATESSSGGESCDEDEKEVDREKKKEGKLRHVPLEQRASWQWWTERSWLGSRWSWIQFQLSDLEYKIRQHVDLHKQLRSRKNAQSFVSLPPKKAVDIQNMTMFSEPICEDSDEEELSTALDGCARTRPVEFAGRRRIVTSKGMYRWNRKTNARSTIYCGCSPPFSPCIVCGGRSDVKQALNAQCQSKNSRNAILEPTYHAVLTPSKRQDIALDRKLQTYWSSKLPARGVSWYPQAKTVVSLTPLQRFSKGSSSAEPSPDDKPRRGRKPGSIIFKRPYNTKSSKLKRAKKSKRHWSGGSSSVQEDGVEAGKVGSRRTTDRQSTFDIDNIFVDPKVAAVSRVERIPYKEIQTPEWRICELSSAGSSINDQAEDLSDASFGQRHEAKETEEKRRFIPILIRDLHSTSRKAQLQRQSSSMDSNGSGPTVAAASRPQGAVLGLGSSKEIGELTYEPFPTRKFPLDVDVDDAEGSLNGGCIFKKSYNGIKSQMFV